MHYVVLLREAGSLFIRSLGIALSVLVARHRRLNRSAGFLTPASGTYLGALATELLGKTVTGESLLGQYAAHEAAHRRTFCIAGRCGCVT